MAQSNALAMSLMWIRGRHGVPSLRLVIFLELTAHATKSLTTRSSRNRSLIPQAEANLKHVTVKSLSASASDPVSGRIFDVAQPASRFNRELSFLKPSSAAPDS